MSQFFKRLKYYGIGFGLGSIFVFMFFQNRGCSWLPANRVKNAILDRVITISDSQQLLLNKKGVKQKDIINLLNTGSINFDKSQKEGDMKVYQVYDDNLKLYFTLPKECFVSEVKICNKEANQIKSTQEGMGKLIHFPNDDDLVFVDTTALLECKLDHTGYINQRRILKSLKKAGKIDFKKSKFWIEPKPEVYLWFKDSKGAPVGSKSIWYKNKINILALDLKDTLLCQ